MISNIDLTIFPPEREEKLKNIWRYNAFEILLYRSNLWMHTHRILWLVEELLPLAQKYVAIDPEKTRILALVHDDVEIITGDIPSRTKAHMSTEQLHNLANEEEHAIDILSEKFPKSVHGYVYRDLLLHAMKKDCTEAQLVSYADKLDAQCESLHEVFAGNLSLLPSIMFYSEVFASFLKKFPVFSAFLTSNTSPLTSIKDIAAPADRNFKTYAHLNKPHTRDSLKIPTDFHFYDTWKKLVIEKGGEEGLGWLVDQRETL